jgi:sodium/hydrogen antiporter
MAKLGFIIPRTLSNALSTQRSEEEEPEPFHVPEHAQETEARLRRRTGGLRSGDTLPQRVVRIGRSIIPSAHGSGSSSRATSQAPTTPASLSAIGTTAPSDEETKKRRAIDGDAQGAQELQRTIRFPDEEPPITGRN